MNVLVSEIQTGEELNGKHFDTKIVFYANNDKIVIHAYNSTCNLKVEGSTYLNFIENYLEPLFVKEVGRCKAEIIECDKSIMTSLGARAPLRTRSVKSIRSSINKQHKQAAFLM